MSVELRLCDCVFAPDEPPFMYSAKAARSECDAGLAAPCHHPTVKPVQLMRWLVRLVARPGALVLDPFVGSGTTGAAAVAEGCDFIGVDTDAEYLQIAGARIHYAVDTASQCSLWGEGR